MADAGRSSLVGAFSYERDGTRVLARGQFGDAHEGPPGHVHGGWIALAFDELLGMVTHAAGTPGMTGRLTVRYRRPTPLHTDVVLDGWCERVEGRRCSALGTLSVDDDVTAEADGLFVQPIDRLD